MLSTQVRKLRLRYLGHVLRYPKERYARQMITVDTEGTTRRGKRSYWIKEVAKDMNNCKAKTNDARDKFKWKNATEDAQFWKTDRRQSEEIQEGIN